MPEKAIVFGVVMVLVFILAAAMIEYFIPLSVYPDFMIDCRRTLLKMEIDGGLSASETDSLRTVLGNRGFTNISVSGTDSAKYGDELVLNVDADYSYSKIVSLFSREDNTQHMKYNRFTVCRKVIN